VTFADLGEATLQVRVYDDGAAFRFTGLPAGGMTESTAFNFAGDYTAWFYNGERHNIGPERLSESDGERLPLMTVKAAEDRYLAVHEADLGPDGWPMRLRSAAGSTSFEVIPETISAGSPFNSAWRVIMCSSTPGGLVDSHLLELLNPEPEGDFNWVKPGVALWDWRIDGAVWDGYHYGMNYDSWTRMIDFAAEQGFSHLVLDANWYGPEFAKDSDPTKGDKARDVQRIIRYGRDKGVGVWLYLNDVAGTNYPIEETLAQYEQWGASGVKYGFMNGTPQEKNRKTQNITALCAKHHLMVDYHDYPVHPFGQMRTWPNAVTREYCKAQLDGRQIFYPKTFVTSVFVNMVAGPVDMNNGFMELHQGRTTRKDNSQEVPSTATAEIARTLITWSGATVIPDIPEYYRKYPRLLEFLSAEKQPWKESITLDGRIGEYIVMMRQNADGDYLVAAATNEDARTLDIPLSFLPKGSWTATVNTDAEDTDYRTQRETCASYDTVVKSSSVLSVRLAPGGGACILIKK
jgi:alpha-glucosidase